jgi:hypothetical protein
MKTPLCRFATSPPAGEKIQVHLVELLLIADFSPPPGGVAEGRGGLLKSRNSLSWFCLNGLKPHCHFVAPPLEGEEIPIAQQIFSPSRGIARRARGCMVQ